MIDVWVNVTQDSEGKYFVWRVIEYDTRFKSEYSYSSECTEATRDGFALRVNFLRLGSFEQVTSYLKYVQEWENDGKCDLTFIR